MATDESDPGRRELEEAQAALLDSLRQNALMRALATAANSATSFTEVLLHARSLLLLHDDWHHAWAYLPQPDGTLRPIDAEGMAAVHSAPELVEQEASLANQALAARSAAWADDGSLAAFVVGIEEQVLAVLTIASDPPIVRREMVESMIDDAALQLARVAEREHSRRELADARDQAMAASRQKSEFLATMSHEIRTPLNGIIGLNDLLLRSTLTPDQLRLATGLGVASHALLGVINDVLDFSKIESGHLELERVSFDPAALLDDVGRLLATATRESGVELVTTCSRELPRRLVGDPVRLSQILTNLAANALKFTDSGDVLVSLDPIAAPVSASERPPVADDGNVWVQAEVRDTGMGITAEQVQRLFEPFTQADASTTRRYGGTGLGLSIARELTTALGGELTYAPNPDGGSIFTFAVAFEPDLADVASTPAAEAADAADRHAGTVLHGRHVVVVDANLHARQALEGRLARWGVRTSAVAGVEGAWAILSGSGSGSAGAGFDAVILTLSSDDDADAAAVASLVAASAGRPSPVPVIGLAPHDSVERAPMLDAGAASVLAKPLTNDQLRVALLRDIAGVSASTSEVADEVAHLGVRRRILVVEDNPINQLVAIGLLESLGYVVDVADDGAAGLQALRTGVYDLVLMDVQMPALDGYGATRALRAAGSRIPVVAMTAAAVEGERERCLAAGMDDFLTKPVIVSALADVLERWLRGSPTPADGFESDDKPDGGPEPTSGHPSDPTPGHTPGPPDLAAVASLERLVEIDDERLDVLRDLDPNNTTYIDRALGNFAVNSVSALAEIRTQLAAGDHDEVRRVAHKLAGSALNLGVVRAGETARAVELGVESAAADLEGLVALLDRSLARARAALDAYRKTLA